MPTPGITSLTFVCASVYTSLLFKNWPNSSRASRAFDVFIVGWMWGLTGTNLYLNHRFKNK